MAKQPERRFTEYVKNPDLFREEMRDGPPPTSDPAALVAAMRTRRLEYEEVQLLRAAGPNVVPVLVAALRDERSPTRRCRPTGCGPYSPASATGQ